MRNKIYFAVFALFLQCIMVFGSWFDVSAADVYSSELVGRSVKGYNPLSGPSYPIVQDSYFTDDYGNILMFVNILGMVQRTGQFIVRDNADFSTILALSGGVLEDADLKKVLVIRREPDTKGNQAYFIDLKSFYKKGDRSSFIVLKPNDTIIVPEKGITLAKIGRAIGVITPFVYIYDLINRN